MSMKRALLSFVAACWINGAVLAAEPLPIYQPKVKTADIYFHHPGAKPALKYNHDVDIVKFKGKFFAAWNGQTAITDLPDRIRLKVTFEGERNTKIRFSALYV